MKINRLNRNHCDKLRRFFSEIDRPEILQNFSPHPMTSTEAKKLCELKTKDSYWVAEEGASIVGYAILRGWDEGFDVPMLGVCIHPDYQNRGVGKKLVAHLIQESRDRGCRKIFLKVKRINLRAIALYLDTGFVFEDFNKDFLKGTLRLEP